MTRLDRLISTLSARTPHVADSSGAREAAVALIVLPSPDRILLVRRAARAGDPWSGQIALPGGRRDASDATLVDTAVRETSEEVGIALDPATLRVTLDDLGPVTPVLPPIVVRPYLFHPVDEPAISVNHEIDQAEWITLEQLADPALRHTEELMVRGGPIRAVGLRLPIGFLWGMTERILSPVIRAWVEA